VHNSGALTFLYRKNQKPIAGLLEQVQQTFLRFLSGGIAKSTPREVLLREYGRLPLHVRWAGMIGNFWDKLVMASNNENHAQRPAVQAFHTSIRAALMGHEDSWAWKVLFSFHRAGVFNIDILNTPGASLDDVLQLPITKCSALSAFQKGWEQNWKPEVVGNDPRTADSGNVMCCTYTIWVLGAIPGTIRSTEDYDRCTNTQKGALHASVALPLELRRALVRLRVGSHTLGVHTGRFTAPGHDPIPREERFCKCCGSNSAVDDLKHFLLECSKLQHIRNLHPALFQNAAGHPFNVLDNPDQHRVARVVSKMIDEHDTIISSRSTGA
jgi:hypothetical protein